MSRIGGLSTLSYRRRAGGQPVAEQQADAIGALQVRGVHPQVTSQRFVEHDQPGAVASSADHGIDSSGNSCAKR